MSAVDLATPPCTEAETGTGPSRLDRLAAWLLGGPLTAGLLVLCMVQLGTWVPHYLTWPWFADHDVFATAAQAWDSGAKPYRDTLGNNFPGTIYLFWVLGKVAGWGNTPALYAADALLVGLLGVVMLVWSQRRFGRWLPGLLGYVSFLAYYLSLDYSQAAQRDWHGPCFAVSALMLLEAWPGRAGRVLSALSMAIALAIRPQTVLLFPGLLAALDEGSREPGESPANTARAALEWGLALGVFVAVAFAPLVLAGVLGDFLRGVRLTAYGGSYNKASPATFLKESLIQLAPFKVGAVVASILLLLGQAARRDRRAALTWLAALAGVLLYKPISPLPHAYLNHPLALVWSVNVAVLVELVLGASIAAPALRLVMVLLILGLGATGRPRFCNPRASLAALSWLKARQDPDVCPLGYTHNPDVGKSAVYDWTDYRNLLAYLRQQVPAHTRVANALKGVPAVAGPTGHCSAFPAESIAWLYMVKHDDEAKFARALEETPDSVVVWAPSEQAIERNFTLELLRPVIVHHYEPAARFGDIEVWRRKAPRREAEGSPQPSSSASPASEPVPRVQ